MTARMKPDEVREPLARTGGCQPESVVPREGRDRLRACDGALRAEEAIEEWQALPWRRRLWEWIRP